jgi:hypothetical protein
MPPLGTAPQVPSHYRSPLFWYWSIRNTQRFERHRFEPSHRQRILQLARTARIRTSVARFRIHLEWIVAEYLDNKNFLRGNTLSGAVRREVKDLIASIEELRRVLKYQRSETRLALAPYLIGQRHPSREPLDLIMPVEMDALEKRLCESMASLEIVESAGHSYLKQRTGGRPRLVARARFLVDIGHALHQASKNASLVVTTHSGVYRALINVCLEAAGELPTYVTHKDMLKAVREFKADLRRTRTTPTQGGKTPPD